MTENEAKLVIERLVGISPSESIVRAVNMATDALEEIQQYRAIGTVEECKEARERYRAKKPNKREDKYTDLIQHYSCPVCGRYFGQAGVHSVILFERPKYCTCGQAIDWSDTD